MPDYDLSLGEVPESLVALLPDSAQFRLGDLPLPLLRRHRAAPAGLAVGDARPTSQSTPSGLSQGGYVWPAGVERHRCGPE